MSYRGTRRTFYNKKRFFKRPRIHPKDAFEEKYPRNFGIQADKVRVLSQEGKNLGIFDLKQAVYMAQQENKDLVLLVPHADPPVCKIVDWENFKYQIQKKDKEARKKNKVKKLKEVKLSPKIAEGDLERKLEQVRKFLEKGHQVKLTIMRKRRITNEQITDFKEVVLTKISPYSTILNVQNKGRNVYILLKSKENAQVKDAQNSSQESKD